MTNDVNFRVLKAQLSKANVIFKSQDGLSKFYFNKCSDSKEFNTRLDLLFDAFSNELRLNLSDLDSTKSKENYLEFILQEFVTLEEKIGDNPDFTKPSSDGDSKRSLDSSYITIRNSDIQDLINCFNCQKNTILQSIKLIKRCRHKFTDRSKKEKLIDGSWADELQEFYPFYMRLKVELSNVNTIEERITYLKKYRKEIAIQFKEKGMDFYGSPLNLYFEARLDCLKDLLHSQNLFDRSSSNIKWIGQKIDLIELVLSLDLLKVVVFMDGNLISRKELCSRFEHFFNLPPINDLDSRIHKLKTRSNGVQFLDQLKESCKRFLNEE